MCGFAVALLAGLNTGNPAHTVLYNAIVALVVCYAVGYFVARAGRWIVIEHLAKQRIENPVPEIPSSMLPGGGVEEGGEWTGPVQTIMPGGDA